ncbi:MAG TPA: hypothetical protein VFU81_20415, partial [Thermomicrobiales bacterium]|nr:hypothetical protein [Thermomicrobiales bacterium]
VGTQGQGARERPVMRRFHGAVEINPQRPIPALTAAIEEVVQHLTALPGATVRVTLEIEADAAVGVPDDIVRAVVENSRTLKFHSAEFEEA